MVRLIISLAAVAVAFEAEAQASPDVRGTARIEWSHKAREKVIVENRIWRCSENICSGAAVESETGKLRLCRQLARHAGRVVSFQTATGPLDTEALVRCNRGL